MCEEHALNLISIIQVPIHVLQNEEDEVMHGVGRRASVRTANAPAHIIDPDFQGTCEGAAVKSQRQREVEMNFVFTSMQ